MRCPNCHGTGYVLPPRYRARPGLPMAWYLRPCPECLNGQIHYCEGECAQPKPDRQEDEDG